MNDPAGTFPGSNPPQVQRSWVWLQPLMRDVTCVKLPLIDDLYQLMLVVVVVRFVLSLL